MSRLLTLVTAALLCLAVAIPAGAATRDVCPSGCTYSSIQAAVAAADPGDTITVAPGTYAEPQILIDKPLTVIGAGSGESIIDGGDATGLPTVGTVHVELAEGDVTFSGFTIRNAGTDTGGTRAALFEKATASGPTFEFTDVVIEGSGDLAGNDYGFYTFNSFADLVFANGSITQTDFNPVLVEQHHGPVEISGNTIAPLSSGSGSAIFFMTYGGVDVTSPQRVYDNVVTGRGITFNGAFGNIAGAGRFTAVEISGNTISDLLSGNAIALVNGDTDPGGADGRIVNAEVVGNRLEGADTGIGVRLLGVVTGTDIDGNSISGFLTGIALEANGGGAPTGTGAHFNRIVGNGTGVANPTAGGMDARNNWWGCNEGPNTADCDSTAGTVDFDPWLVLGVDATPSNIATGGDTSTVAADVLSNSDGATPSGGTLPDGDPVAFATTLGSIAPATEPLTAGGADATLTSGDTPGTATVSAAFDNETVSTPVTFTATCDTDGADLDGDGTSDDCDVDDDGDGLDDATEAQIGTNPRNPDSDGDGVRDGGDACPTLSGTSANGCPQGGGGLDNQPPTVSFTAPAPGARLSADQPTTLAASASDDRGVVRVDFYAAGTRVCSDEAAPYTCDYSPVGADVPKLLLLAVAFDASNQIGLAAQTAKVSRFDALGLRARTTPKRDSTLPHKFVTRGRLRLPDGVTPELGCSGEVTVQFKALRSTVSTRRAQLTDDCRFRSSVTFRLPERLRPKLRVRARFGGNTVLKRELAPRRKVRTT